MLGKKYISQCVFSNKPKLTIKQSCLLTIIMVFVPRNSFRSFSYIRLVIYSRFNPERDFMQPEGQISKSVTDFRHSQIILEQGQRV